MAANDPGAALGFLKGMIEKAQDENQRAALIQHYKKALHEVNFRLLEDAANEFLSRFGRYPAGIEEASAGLQKPLPLTDPFGGKYFFNPGSRTVESTSKIERIKLFSKSNKSPTQKLLEENP